jgi:hypothetical protein
MTLDPRSPDVQVVTAAAGSGKTTLLLHHYLRHLQTSTIDRVVAITFTRKAAAELTTRLARILRGVVDPASIVGPDRLREQKLYADVLPPLDKARAALASLQSAPVCTVDAFTLSLVQEFVLHAYLPLSEGKRAYIDGPVSGGAATAGIYEGEARSVLDALSPDARILLAELTVGEAVSDLAQLARVEGPFGPSCGEWLDALGAALAKEVPADRKAWLAAEVDLGTASARPPRMALRRDGRGRDARSRSRDVGCTRGCRPSPRADAVGDQTLPAELARLDRRWLDRAS